MNAELLDVLSARTGLVCLVGAGGKKTTLYQLAGAHRGRVGITTTVQITPFPIKLGAHEIIAVERDLQREVSRAAEKWRRVAYARPSEKHGRFAGIDPRLVSEIHEAAGFDVTLIKADGARSRWIKAPDTYEPQIPENVGTVIPIVSARAIGEDLTDRIAHRIERLVVVTGAKPDKPITTEHVARLLAAEQGALRDVGDAEVVPVINMVDDAKRERLAREAAEQALALSKRFDRVVLASMKNDDPLVCVIRR